MDECTPILIGAGQITQRDVDPGAALEPVDLMRESARRAAADAGLPEAALARLDSVSVVNILSWSYANAPRLLAERIGAQPNEEIYTTVGGNSPQMLVNDTAARIADGSVGFAILAGVEAMHTMTRARRAGVRLAWSSASADPPRVVGDARSGTTDHELRHGLFLPVQIYPLFENALRACRGRTPQEHLRALGTLYAGLSRVAAANPYAWFRTERSAAEIARVSEQNRIIAFPYPKLMNAIIDVDQAAAVLMTSVGMARALGVPRERWVYLQGCGDAHDLWFVSERRDYASSPAIAAAGAQALAMAGAGIGEIDLFDLYSCFPSALQLAMDALGHRRGRLAPAHRYRRAGGVRRSWQQLLDARDREHARARAQHAGHARSGDGARLVRDQARDRYLRDRARTAAVASGRRFTTAGPACDAASGARREPGRAGDDRDLHHRP